MKHVALLPVTFLAAAMALSVAGMPVGPAEAAIKCQGTDQVTRHGLIRTPWCEDAYLAQLSGYPARAVRQDPRVKQKACARVGNKLSLSRTCFGIVPSLLVPGT